MSSYRQIFKTSALFGGTQLIIIILGIIRTKFLAMLLGPAGVGIVGMYQSTTGLISTVAGFGIGRAGVRQVAEALGSGDEDKIALTGKTLRWVSLASGFLGMLTVLSFCKPITLATFGNDRYLWGIATVSLVLLFNGISDGQMALLQGMRKLKDLAACKVLGTLFGSVVSIAAIYFWGQQAVAGYLVVIAAFSILTSWWYARKVQIKSSQVSIQNVILEARVLLKIGTAFMVSGLVSAGTIYFTRILVVRELGLDAVGLYTAVITLSSIYVNMVLQAMVADYYPRLTAVASDHEAVNRMVNEQTEMGLLLALPGILVMLSLAPWVLSLLYTQAFSTAADVIRWQLLGVTLRLVSWPIGIIMPAKGMSRFLVVSEILVAAVQVLSLIIGMKLWGFEGVGISFFVTYATHVAIVVLIAKKVTGFCWSYKAMFIILLTCVVVATVFVAVRVLPSVAGTVISLAITTIISVWCLFTLKKMVGFKLFRLKH